MPLGLKHTIGDSRIPVQHASFAPMLQSAVPFACSHLGECHYPQRVRHLQRRRRSVPVVLHNDTRFAQPRRGVTRSKSELGCVSESVSPTCWLLFSVEGFCCFLIQRRSVGEPTLAPR